VNTPRFPQYHDFDEDDAAFAREWAEGREAVAAAFAAQWAGGHDDDAADEAREAVAAAWVGDGPAVSAPSADEAVDVVADALPDDTPDTSDASDAAGAWIGGAAAAAAAVGVPLAAQWAAAETAAAPQATSDDVRERYEYFEQVEYEELPTEATDAGSVESDVVESDVVESDVVEADVVDAWSQEDAAAHSVAGVEDATLAVPAAVGGVATGAVAWADEDSVPSGTEAPLHEAEAADLIEAINADPEMPTIVDTTTLDAAPAENGAAGESAEVSSVGVEHETDNLAPSVDEPEAEVDEPAVDAGELPAAMAAAAVSASPLVGLAAAGTWLAHDRDESDEVGYTPAPGDAVATDTVGDSTADDMHPADVPIDDQVASAETPWSATSPATPIAQADQIDAINADPEMPTIIDTTGLDLTDDVPSTDPDLGDESEVRDESERLAEPTDHDDAHGTAAALTGSAAAGLAAAGSWLGWGHSPATPSEADSLDSGYEVVGEPDVEAEDLADPDRATAIMDSASAAGSPLGGMAAAAAILAGTSPDSPVEIIDEAEDLADPDRATAIMDSASAAGSSLDGMAAAAAVLAGTSPDSPVEIIDEPVVEDATNPASSIDAINADPEMPTIIDTTDLDLTHEQDDQADDQMAAQIDAEQTDERIDAGDTPDPVAPAAAALTGSAAAGLAAAGSWLGWGHSPATPNEADDPVPTDEPSDEPVATAETPWSASSPATPVAEADQIEAISADPEMPTIIDTTDLDLTQDDQADDGQVAVQIDAEQTDEWIDAGSTPDPVVPVAAALTGSAAAGLAAAGSLLGWGHSPATPNEADDTVPADEPSDEFVGAATTPWSASSPATPVADADQIEAISADPEMPTIIDTTGLDLTHEQDHQADDQAAAQIDAEQIDKRIAAGDTLHPVVNEADDAVPADAPNVELVAAAATPWSASSSATPAAEADQIEAINADPEMPTIIDTTDLDLTHDQDDDDQAGAQINAEQTDERIDAGYTPDPVVPVAAALTGSAAAGLAAAGAWLGWGRDDETTDPRAPEEASASSVETPWSASSPATPVAEADQIEAINADPEMPTIIDTTTLDVSDAESSAAGWAPGSEAHGEVEETPAAWAASDYVDNEVADGPADDIAPPVVPDRIETDHGYQATEADLESWASSTPGVAASEAFAPTEESADAQPVGAALTGAAAAGVASAGAWLGWRDDDARTAADEISVDGDDPVDAVNADPEMPTIIDTTDLDLTEGNAPAATAASDSTDTDASSLMDVREAGDRSWFDRAMHRIAELFDEPNV
jgi:hypothetical protein